MVISVMDGVTLTEILLLFHFQIPIGILQAVNSMLKMIVGGKVNVYVG